jgi:predicted flavoprotein YhiN
MKAYQPMKLWGRVNDKEELKPYETKVAKALAKAYEAMGRSIHKEVLLTHMKYRGYEVLQLSDFIKNRIHQHIQYDASICI